ncbi:MAG: hypothetical protein EOP48_15180, partial [Sphingobacteriales bacterium]
MRNTIPYLLAIVLTASCTQRKSDGSLKTSPDLKKHHDSEMQNSKLESIPFIGKRQFETRFGVSGTGTPSRFIEITEDGNVFFSFNQPVIDTDSFL